MKVVILCGGRGVRMGAVSEELPKPLIRIGDKPILWHIMKIYSSYGFHEFILLLGYKGELIRDFFSRKENVEDVWKIDFVDTGLDVKKSERLKKAKELVDGENFFLAYGDDVADVDIKKILKFHEYKDTIITLTAVRLLSPFGILEMDEENAVTNFKEKPVLEYWINGGFMVCKKEIFDYLNSGELEEDVFKELIRKNQLSAYKHKGNWKSMNTLKENMELNKLWEEGNAFWKFWND